MITVKSRTITLSYTQQEIEEVNAILIDLQEKHGFESETMKGLFLQILRNSTLSGQNSNETQLNLTEIQSEFETKIQALINENSQLSDENKQLTLNLEELQNNQEVEIIEIQKEFTPNPTDIFIQLPEQKAQILHTICQNRHAKGYDKELLTNSQLADKLIFNKGTLYNWHGEIFTGL